MTDMQEEPTAKKIRSCSSSETPSSISHTHPSSSSLSASSILDAARRYDFMAHRRYDDATTAVSYAKDEVLACMEALRRAHERLGKAEASAVESAEAVRVAKEYRSVLEVRLLGRGASDRGEGGVTSLSTSVEDDEDGKHVSFKMPQHDSYHQNALSTKSTSGSVDFSGSIPDVVRRKRIRVSEHGWGAYEGHLDSRGEPHGSGTVTWENGGKYNGDWVDGKANGRGVMNYGNGDRYEGSWRDGHRYGRGLHHFFDGGVYDGEWRNAAPDGLGKMTLKNGSHYEGMWKDGKWHGAGIVRPANGGEWEGTFTMGKCTIGTLRRPNGELEVGRYDSVNPDDVKEGVWWSIDRRSVWIVVDGQKMEQISNEKALEMVVKIGMPLPFEFREAAQQFPSEPTVQVKSEE